MFKIIKKFKVFIFILIFLIFIFFIFSFGKIYDKKDLDYGITFSEKHARSLKLDWQETFLAILDDLKVKKIRIPAYWDIVEAENNNFNYKSLDWQLNEARKRDVEVILAVGIRLPRWPECHLPDWVNNLEKAEREKETLEYITKIINRYNDYNNITFWQVENEPFLPGFGECPPFDVDFLDKEIALVRKLSNKKIIITDSGELSLWIPAAKRGDVFGTTFYLNTFSARLGKYIHYPITPSFFHFKRNITKLFTKQKEFIVIELQAEPWGPIAYQFLSKEEQSKTMDIEKFKHILEFSRKSGFKTFYLWGVEWWYFEKELNNYPIFWQAAKKLFNN